MMIDSKVPSRWYTVSSVSNPTLANSRHNHALPVRISKHTTGLSGYAKTAAIWAPKRDSEMCMATAAAGHAVSAHREWIHHYSSCKHYFRDSLQEYLQEYPHTPRLRRLNSQPGLLADRPKRAGSKTHF